MNKPKLTMIELFSGIGAQKRGIDNTDLYDLEVVATSDIDKEATVEYAAIHHGLTNEMIENYENYPSREEMIKELKDRNIGLDFEKNKMYDWDKLIKKKTKEIEKYWLAMTLQNNLGDISKIEQLPYADCWFYSSPCQCFSLAGKQDGIDATCNTCGQKYNPMNYDVDKRYICPHCGSDDIQGTRSGLLLEVERLLVKSIETNTQPKYLCLENVKNLVGSKFKEDFDAWVKRLEHLGYNTYWQVLNAKECGIPQNRERVFAFSIRKDIDTGKFTFPVPFDNGFRLKDILEKNVEEKYYINTERASNLIQQLVDKGQLKGQKEDNKSILVKNQATEYSRTIDAANTLMARDWKGFGNQDMVAIVESEKIDNAERIGGMFDGDTRHQAGSVWNTSGMAPTLDTMQGGLRQPCIVEDASEPKERFFKQALETFNNNDCNEGDTIDAFNKRVNKSGYCPTLTTRPEGFKTAILPVVKDDTIESSLNNIEETNTPQFVVGSTQKNAFVGDGEISSALTSAMGMGGGHIPMLGFENTTKPICVGNTTPSGKSQCNAVYSTEGVSQTLCAGTHGYATGSILEEKPEVTPTEDGVQYNKNVYRIRKLTVRECIALMGFEFEDWDKCVAVGCSNTAGYKAAGNSIVTDCIKLLFEHLYKAQYDDTYICTDEKMQNFQSPEVK